MSNIIRNWVKTLHIGNGIAKQVLLEIADCADSSGVCDRTIPQLAAVLELSEVSVKRGLKILVDKKLLDRSKSEREHGHWEKKITQVVLPDFVQKKLGMPGKKEAQIDDEPSIPQIRGEVKNEQPGISQIPAPGISQTGYLTDTYNIEESFDNNTQEESTRDAGARAKPHVPANFAKFPMLELYESFPNLLLRKEQIADIVEEVKEPDKAAWLATIKLYRRNHDPTKDKYNPEKVGNLLSVFDQEKKRLANGAKKGGQIRPNINGNAAENGKKSNYEISKSRDYSEFDDFDPIEVFAEKT